jgi:hypothetical protein
MTYQMGKIRIDPANFRGAWMLIVCHTVSYFPTFTAVCQVPIQIFDKLLFATMGGMPGALVRDSPLAKGTLGFPANGNYFGLVVKGKQLIDEWFAGRYLLGSGCAIALATAGLMRMKWEYIP